MFNLGFAGVNAPIEAGPQEIPSQFRPEMADTPELPDAGVGNIRTQGTLAKRKPPVTDLDAKNLTYAMNPGALQAEEYANDMRASFAVSRAYDRRNAAVAKARARRNDRSLEKSDKQGVRTRRKLQGTTNRRTDSFILRNARDVLGMGTDLYR